MKPEGDEPRARDVLAAVPGVAVGLDPSARWEQLAPSPPARLSAFEQRIDVRLDPERWSYVRAFERREYDLPSQLAADLQECVPQWFLRDLDRPDEQRGAPLQPREDSRLLGLWEEGLAETRRWREREKAPRIVAATELFVEEQERRRRFFGEPWEPMLRDDEPRRIVVIHPGG